MGRWSRRDFLVSSVALGGGLLMGCQPARLPPKEPGSEPTSSDAGGTDAKTLSDARSEPITRPDSAEWGSEQGGIEPAPEIMDAAEITPEVAGESPPERLADAGVECTNPFAGGQLLGVVAFVNEGGRQLNQVYGKGWDGRLYYDLSDLSEKLLHTPNDKFFVRTRYPDQIDPKTPWTIKMSGHIQAPVTVTMGDLTPLVKPMGSVLLECSGNGKAGNYGLLSAATWEGVPVDQVLAKAKPTSKATRVLISGFDKHSTPSTHSTPGCSWVFTLDELKQYGAFFATKMNGVPLPKDHGFPVRLVMPRWYGCTNVKWVDEIRFVDDTEPATSQMIEFATRTHQTRQHALAKDYAPATMDQAAMPIRIEKWQVNGKLTYRVIGVMWGGYKVTTSLGISFRTGGPFTPVRVCPAPTTNDTWSLWEHQWTPESTGTYSIRMKVNDASVRTRRLDSSFYLRQVGIDSV